MPIARRQQHWDSSDDPAVPLERNLCGHPLAGLLWERTLENVVIEEGWEKVPGEECLYLHRNLPQIYRTGESIVPVNVCAEKHNSG